MAASNYSLEDAILNSLINAIAGDEQEEIGVDYSLIDDNEFLKSILKNGSSDPLKDSGLVEVSIIRLYNSLKKSKNFLDEKKIKKELKKYRKALETLDIISTSRSLSNYLLNTYNFNIDDNLDNIQNLLSLFSSKINSLL